MNLTFKSITQLARELRSDPTPGERRLWKYLRRRQFRGYKFLRQRPFVHETIDGRKYFYITDFYCAELNLVLELDGRHHKFQREEDYQRDLVLNSLGLTVIRIKNEELDDMDAVISKLEALVGE